MVRVAYESSLLIASIFLSEVGIMVVAESEATNQQDCRLQVNQRVEAHIDTQAPYKLAFALAPAQRYQGEKEGDFRASGTVPRSEDLTSPVLEGLCR